MSDYPDPPRTDWGEFAVLSELDPEDDSVPDPEAYRDLWGLVQDRENWRPIRRKILEDGSYADRPETAPFDGAKYHATDINTVFAWDEAAEEWTPLNTGTADDPVPGTTHLEAAHIDHARTAETPVWNVEAHGIEGDGTTKVGQDVHDLLERVDEAGGGIVYFPPGRYLLERTPLIGDETIVAGSGRATVLQGVRPDDIEGRALLSNRGFDESDYDGASNWGVRDVRIDSPKTNGIMPAHAENVRLEGIYGDEIYYHHIDIVSSKNVTVDGYWATRGGEGDSDAPFQFDNQNSGTGANGVWDGENTLLAAGDDTPAKNCSLRNFEIDPKNDPEYGVHIHRNGNELLTIENGLVTGCQDSAIRAGPGDLIGDLVIDGVSCLDNARGIRLGHVEDGRQELTISNVTIRTDNPDLAAGSGLYASGFDGASISNVTVDGAFENTILFDDMDDLKLHSVTATGADNQAFRFRENVNATLTTARAAECGTVGIYSGSGSSVAYGGVTFDDVDTETDTAEDGELRAWATS